MIIIIIVFFRKKQQQENYQHPDNQHNNLDYNFEFWLAGIGTGEDVRESFTSLNRFKRFTIFKVIIPVDVSTKVKFLQRLKTFKTFTYLLI